MNSKKIMTARKIGISLLYKIMALNLIFVMLPLVITGLFSYLNYRTTLQTQSEELFKNYVDSTVNNLEQMIYNAGSIAMSCYYNENVLQVLSNHSIPDTEKYLTSQEGEYIRHFVNTVYNDNIKDIFFITNDDYIVGCINTQVIRKMTSKTKDFFNKINSTEGEIILFPLHVPDYYNTKNCEVVSIGRLIREPLTNKTLGAVIVDISAEEMEKTIYNDVDRENIIITVYDKKGRFFFGEKTNSTNISRGDMVIQKSGGEMYYRSLSSKLDLVIAGTLKGDIINQGMYKLLIFMIYISIFTLITIWVISILFFNRLMKPLRILKNKMELITRNNLSERIEVRSNDEIGELTYIFNHMADEIQRFVKNILELTKREKEVSIIALQSQIKPHFLYNVLESVNMYAVKRKYNDICDIISSLGKNLRYVSSNSEDFVYLYDEVNFIRDYLKIQIFRYEKRLSYEINIDDNALKCIVPKMILQPFVENSIEHGMGDGTLKINVYSRREDSKLLLFVEDNGKGIEHHKAEQILKRLYEDSCENNKPEDIKYLGKGYALNNINQRLKLYFGEGCGIFIDMQYANGARFFLKMPYNAEEEYLKTPQD